MTCDNTWKELFDFSQKELTASNERFLVFFDKTSKESLGDLYFEYKDAVMVKELKEIIVDFEDPCFDKYETPDNKAYDVASFYRVLKYFMMQRDYQKFVEERRDAKTKECD